MVKTAAVTSFVVATVLLGSISAQTQLIDIFNIGDKNGSHTEFVQNRETGRAVLYEVGESSAEKDWPAFQPGSFDSIVGRSTMQHDWTEVHPDSLPKPFQIRFNLAPLRLKELSFCISMPSFGIAALRRLSTEL